MPAPSARRSTASVASAALAAAALAAAPAARAQVVYSGPVNLTIPRSQDGFFVNVVTGATYSGPFYPTCPGPVCNFDFSIADGRNILGRLFFAPFSDGSIPEQRGYVSTSPNGFPIVLAPGTLIGSTSVFNGDRVDSPTTAFEGGTNVIFGFRFRNEAGGANTTHYGWGRVSLRTGGDGTLVDYGFNATAGASIAAGDVGAVVIPEPSTYVMLGAGLLGVAAVARRRRAA
jgi:hypothetical protein